MTTPPPYTGITGFISPTEVEQALSLQHEFITRRPLMVGVLVSDMSLFGERNKHARRYPKVANVAEIFSPNPRGVNVVSYTAADTRDFSERLERIYEISGRHLHGIQLNLVWPSAQVLFSFYRRHRHIERLILHLGYNSFRLCDNEPYKACQKLSAYRGSITDVVVSPSRSKRGELDVAQTERYILAIREACPDLGITVSGGLNFDTLPKIRHLIAKYDVSIDSRGEMRNRNDLLDPDLVRRYLTRAASFTA